MSRDPKLYLSDILYAITKIQNWTQGMSLDDFESDELVRDAVLRNQEIIGEAVKGLPLELAVAHPEIPWRVLGDFRNRLAHGHFSIDSDIVWKVIQNRLPGLRQAIQRVSTCLGNQEP